MMLTGAAVLRPGDWVAFDGPKLPITAVAEPHELHDGHDTVGKVVLRIR